MKSSFNFLTIISVLIFGVFVLHKQTFTHVHAVSQDILISEIQIGGPTANDEFVELYNSTNQPVDLSGWRLSRRSAAVNGTLTTLVSNMTGSIQPHGYFLIANPNYTGAVAPDLLYSSTTSGIAANNTVILYRDNGLTIVDKVAMGTAEDSEGTSASVPESGSSIERKANNLSTDITMSPGGVDEFAGNGYDSDNNAQDFVVRVASQPQHSASYKEPNDSLPVPTPTSTPILPTPTIEPSITPTVVPTILPTVIPTNTPTSIPTPTLLPLTPTPSIITPTPRIREYIFPSMKLVCQWKLKPHTLLGRTFWIPSMQCFTVQL